MILFHFFMNSLFKTKNPHVNTNLSFSNEEYELWDKKIAEQHKYFESIYKTTLEIIYNTKMSMREYKKYCTAYKENALIQCDILNQKIIGILDDNSMSSAFFSFNEFSSDIIKYVKRILTDELEDHEILSNLIKFTCILDILNSRRFKVLITQIRNNQPDPRIWSHKDWIKELLGDAILTSDMIENMFKPGNFKYFSFIFSHNISIYSYSDILQIFTNNFNHPEFFIADEEKNKIKNFFLNIERLNRIIHSAYAIFNDKKEEYEKQKKILRILQLNRNKSCNFVI